MAEVKFPDNRSPAEKGEEQREHRFEPVVKGTVKAVKKTETRRLIDAFIPEDTGSFKEWLLYDVFVPGIKNAIVDSVNLLVYGTTGQVGGRKRNGSYTPYGKISREYQDNDRSSRRSVYDFDELIFETRGEAEMVLDQLEEALDQYGLVTVADMYDFAGYTSRYTDNRYGWTDISSARTQRRRDGYVLLMPRPKPINTR